MRLNYIYIFVGFLIVVLLGYVSNRVLNRVSNSNVEHFDGDMEFKDCETPVDIYDGFYSKINDELFLSKARNQFEVIQVRTNTIKPFKGKINILDLGCGVGHQVKLFNDFKYNVSGVDVSKNMIARAKTTYPLLQFKTGDMMEPGLYEPRQFSHITCFFFSIYYIEEPRIVFQNANRWLKDDGYFIVHLVDKRKFDPVLERSSSLLPLYNPQKHSRKTRTSLKFNKFDYLADWNLKSNPVTFSEVFKFDNGKVRKNTHSLYMYTMKKYSKIANECGFELTQTVDMAVVNHPFNYLFCFKKKFG